MRIGWLFHPEVARRWFCVVTEGVLTLVFAFWLQSLKSRQRPTLLQSWRKNRQASPLWEGAFEKQVAETVINSDLSSLNISRNAKRALHHVSREAAYAKQTTYAQCKAPPCLCPRQSFNNCSTIAQRPCAYVFAKPRLTLRLPWEAALFFCYIIKEGLF